MTSTKIARNNAPIPPALRPKAIPKRKYATARTVVALMLREMSSRYGGKPGGYVWALLEPLAAIILLSIGFSLMLRAPSLGNSFILFYATGYLPFNLYQGVSLTVARAMIFSKPLLLYPSVTWLDSILARFILNTLTQLTLTFLLLAGILAVVDTRVVLDVKPVIEAMGMAALLGLGVGTMNCLLMGMFPTWDVVWSIITRPLFLASAIFYTYENLPGFAQSILWYNPLVHIIGIMRSGFYPMYNPQYASPIFVNSVSLILLCFGILLLGRYHKDILNS